MTDGQTDGEKDKEALEGFYEDCLFGTAAFFSSSLCSFPRAFVCTLFFHRNNDLLRVMKWEEKRV